MEKIYIKTYGCSNNQAESEIMEGLLKEKGYVFSDEKEADLVIVNTCSVKSSTENTIVADVKRLDSLGKKIVIAGCISDADPMLARKLAVKAGIIGTHNISKINEVVENTLEGRQIEITGKNTEIKILQPKIRKNPIIDIVPIESGCNSNCTFCSTKLAKGDLKSYSIEDITKQIKSARQEGCKEFWLTGQDCSCYGFDIGTDMADLINDVTSKIDGRYFIRVGMMNPLHTKKFTQKLIDAYKHHNVFKFLHLPVQSGSDNILIEMRRGHNSENYFYIVDEFRKNFPKMSLVTDIIVGFPGESDEDFQKSIELIEKSRPEFVNVSKFASRPGTRASKMKQLPSQLLKERSEKLWQIVTRIALEKNKEWVGWKGQAIVDEYNHEKGTWLAKNFAYRPIIIQNDRKLELGQLVDVEIVDANRSLVGKLV
ncbi:MAG: tRNA (N(6)-L-threonylcarbamoyladenosine(37)-C(2))-methylthiotransferase [Candidatus Aenigmarchaeota archaeon]|nr:tRNA (N(6)-L-threonylcarbamoyladenosine(37)-C(2))-methylthiotransferase [Candidatus Aenigmarchaeota archaeon]